MAADIRQAKISTRITIGKAVVIKTQQMQHGSVQVMHVDRIFRSAKPKLIRRSVNRAAPDSSSRHPASEPVVIVVATVKRSHYSVAW